MVMLSRKAMMGAQGAASVQYLLRDDFTTDEAAPLTSPRTAEPGPGTLTFSDANEVMSIENGQLRWNGTAAQYNRVHTDLQTFQGGAAWVWDVPTRTVAALDFYIGVATEASFHSFYKLAVLYTVVDRVRVYSQTTTIGAIMLGPNEHRFVMLSLPSGRALLFARNGLTGDFTLLWSLPPNDGDELWEAYVSKGTVAQDMWIDNLRRLQLPGNFASEWGLATDYAETPANGETIDTSADGLVEVTWTPQATDTLDLQVRRTDDDNCWIVRCDQASNKVYLYQKEGGVETESGATGGMDNTFTADTEHRIAVRCDGAWLHVTANQRPMQTYTSATFNQTATGAKVVGTGALADLAAWPLAVTMPEPINTYELAESSTLERVSQQSLGWTNVSHDWAGRAVLLDNDGTWIAAYRTGDDHNIDVDARLHLRFSANEGVDWTDEDTFTDGNPVSGAPFAPQVAGKALTECVLMRAPNGNLILHSYERAGGGTSQWSSADDGASWTYDGVINADTTLVAADDYKVVGSTIYVVARVDPGSDFSHPHYLAFYKNENNGAIADWVKVSDVEAVLDCNEAGLLHVGGNVLHVYVKDTYNYATYRYVSDDLGATWGDREHLTYQLARMNKPRCKTLGGYHWMCGRDYRPGDYRTIVYRSADAQTWEPRFYPFTAETEGGDCGYCDLLQRADGDLYLLSYVGETIAAVITEAVFRES